MSSRREAAELARIAGDQATTATAFRVSVPLADHRRSRWPMPGRGKRIGLLARC